MRPGYLVKNVAPGNNTLDTLNCEETASLDNSVVWSSGDYSFAEEYSVKGWFKSEAVCDKPQTIFRFTIDLIDPENINYASSYENGDLKAEGAELGKNQIVGSIVGGYFVVHSYTFGIQESHQDVLVNIPIGNVRASEWLFVSVAYNFGLKRARAFLFQHGEERWQSREDTHHIIPKYVGFIVGDAFEGQHSDPTVCIAAKDGDCDKDDYSNEI